MLLFNSMQLYGNREGGEDIGTIDDSAPHPAQAQTGHLASPGLHGERLHKGVAGAGIRRSETYDQERRVSDGCHGQTMEGRVVDLREPPRSTESKTSGHRK